MKLNTLVLIVLSSLTTSLYATTDRYRLTLRDDPATTIVVGWDQVSGSSPVVHYGPVDQGTNWNAYPSSTAPNRTVSYKGMNNQFARITGLQPNTAYYFVIRDSQGTSDRYWFKTAPNSPTERLSFIAGGDSRNNRTPRQNANRLVAKLKPHAVMFGGDMTDDDTNAQWQTWFSDWQLTIAGDGRMFPIVAARGNHEDSNNSIYNLFDVPSSSVYYAITFGGSLIRTYTLNTETSISGSQTSWLVSDLQSATTKWKMAQYHKPMRPHVSAKSEGNSQYSSWAQPFSDNNVNLVVECDAHTVKTTWPVRPSTGSGSEEGFVRDDNNGTVYVGEGCWGAPLRSNNDDKVWTRNSARFNQFKWIFVDQGKIEVRTVKVDNASSVGEVSNSNPFTIPSNLDIWNPSNGSVVTITGSGQVPTCVINSPSNGQFYSAPQNITVSANASDADGTVAQVEFFVNGNSIGTDASSPYSISYTIPADGSYSLTAVATDNDGLTATSAAISINVGTISESINVKIANGADDVEQNGVNGTMYTNSSDIELVADGSKGNQVVGLRFQNINIPQGANITNAYIHFTVDETNTGSTNLTIRGEDVNNASAFGTSTNNVSNRTKTSASIGWNPSTWNTVGASGSAQATPDIKNVVQEIVSRSGWSTGNSVVVIITGSGERTAESYDGCASCAPTLHVDYSFGGGSAPSNVAPTCAMTSPSNGTDYTTLQSVAISANANDSDGSVSQVEFFVNGSSIGTDTSSPFSRSWTIPSFGSYNLTAVATDNDGASTTSAAVSVTATDQSGGGCSNVAVNFNDFEGGWGIWNDAGSDSRRSSSDASYANSGTYCVRLRDNSSASNTYTDPMNLSSFENIKVVFSYICNSMDNSNEDFWLQVSTNNGSSYTTVEEWNRGDEFHNNVRYNDEVTIQGPFTSSTRLRFVCDASSNGDQVYLDDINITGCSTGGSGARMSDLIADDGSFGDESADDWDVEEVNIYPNPVTDVLNVDLSEIEENGEAYFYGTEGSLLSTMNFNAEDNTLSIDVSSLSGGVYTLEIQTESILMTKKVLKAE